MDISSLITVIVPTSPIPSHPSTRIIDRTIASAKHHLPDSPIVVTCDGVPERWKEKASDYEEYKERIDKRWPGVDVFSYPNHVHQTGMLPVALSFVLTPVLLYLEHDWELLDPIEWGKLTMMIVDDKVDYIKFHAGERIHPLHEHMMIDRVFDGDVPLIRTRQWSQNPHLASADFYRKLYAEHLEGKNCFIEDAVHGIVGQSARWDNFRCVIYNPIHGSMKRVEHLKGRESNE